MKAKKWLIIIGSVLVVVFVGVVWMLNARGTTDIEVDAHIERLTVHSSAFADLEAMPDAYTGRGEDISPGFTLANLAGEAVSVAIIMDDLDIPVMRNYTHWVIWNIPAAEEIPEAIPPGESVPGLGGAVQGVAYGKNEYKGPMPPFGTHRYQFHLFVLDSMLDLESTAGKKELLLAMDGHVLQYGTLTGWYPTAG